MLATAIQMAKDILNNIITTIAQLPGQLWAKLSEAASKLIEFVALAKTNATKAGEQALKGIMDQIKKLPSQLWNAVKDAAAKLLNIGSTLWNNAKSAGSKIWNGFKAGLGISSPSHLERAMDDIMFKSDEMEKEVNMNVQKVDPVPNADVAFAGSMGGNGGQTVYNITGNTFGSRDDVDYLVGELKRLHV